MTYDYYLQTDSSKSVRRYPKGSNVGQRWIYATNQWTDKSADRRSCELSADRLLTSDEVTTSGKDELVMRVSLPA